MTPSLIISKRDWQAVNSPPFREKEEHVAIASLPWEEWTSPANEVFFQAHEETTTES